MYRTFGKRIVDLAIALTGLILLFPLLLFIFVLLFFHFKGNPFFFQPRPGYNEKIFRIIKFKTMRNARDRYGELLPDAERITKIGAFIRKTSLDELPQLINVLIGEMGLVGPRPLLIEYLPLYHPNHRKRHNVRPGITGWAQVNGRNEISWENKFELDLWYIENHSAALDLKILLLTVLRLLNRRDVGAVSQIEMKKFKG